MLLKKWEELPDSIKVDEVRSYYAILEKKKLGLAIKRIFDIVVGVALFCVLIIPMCVIAVLIKIDSKGPVFYRQERVTRYGKVFKIHKFRTMVSNADQIGSLVTTSNDNRVTKVGAKLRKTRLDELPQLIDIIVGNMSFVGTRPEVMKYVKMYKPEYNATLLLSAGLTSEASIRYKDEADLLDKAVDVDLVYLNRVLPEKMKINLQSIRRFSFFREMMTILRTIMAMCGKKYA